MERAACCHCRSLRVTLTGEPVVVSVCHCRDCQRRTGVVMHSDVYFNGEQVRIEGPDPDFPPPTCSLCEETQHAWITLPDGIQHFRQARV